jgi:hypothetical protein
LRFRYRGFYGEADDKLLEVVGEGKFRSSAQWGRGRRPTVSSESIHGKPP